VEGGSSGQSLGWVCRPAWRVGILCAVGQESHIRLMLIMARSAERRAQFSYFAARCALSMLVIDVSHSAERVNNLNRNSVLGVSSLVVGGGDFS
jgi:hypothetical protein